MGIDGKSGSLFKHGSKFTYTVIGSILVVIFLMIICMVSGPQHSIFGQLQRDGYTGSQEQWLVSLVGEDLKEPGTKTAYELAKENGYTGSIEEWMVTILGAEKINPELTTYESAVENGYDGDLTDWLKSISYHPDQLGKSVDQSHLSEYELACQFGFTGTFIEWIVSVSHDKLFK